MSIKVLLFASLLAVSAYGVLGSSDTDGTSAFECTVAGKFPVSDDCHYYNECHPIRESGVFYLQTNSCPNETNYDDSLNECRDAALSRLECLDEGSISVQLTDMIKDAESICTRIESIDRLETNVISTLNLRRSLEFAVTFNGYIEHYNQDLEAVQAGMGVWRKGNDILSEIRRIYTLAKDYEKEFDRKYEISNKRLKLIPTKVETKRDILNEDIKELKNNIKEAKENLPIGGHTRMENRIATMEERLINKEGKLRNNTQVRLELEELITFLEYVNRDASRIVDLASVSQERIAELYKNMMNAEVTFRKYATDATRDLENLKTEEKHLEAQLENKKREELNVEAKKSELNDKERKLNIDMDENNKHIKDLNERIEEQQTIFNGKKGIWCSLTLLLDEFISVNPSERCGRLLESQGFVYKGKDLETQREDCYETMTQLTTEIQKLQPQFASTNQELEAVRASIPAIEEKKKEIKIEVRDFVMFVPDVEKLRDDLHSTYSVISDTQEGIQKVESAFRLITEVLDKMIDRVKEAGNETEKENDEIYIIQDLSTLQELIDKSSENITGIENCSTLA